MAQEPVLRIGREATTVHRGPEKLVDLPVGCSTLASRFRRTPPSEADIELAIDVVEEAIGRSPARLHSSVLWQADGQDVAAFAHAAGLADADRVLSAAAVENLFTRLAAGAYGAITAAEALPADPAFTGTLVLLRELMHHCAIETVVLPPS